MIRLLSTGALLLALSACGLTGDLERPDPLFGEKRDTLQPAEPISDNTVGLEDGATAVFDEQEKLIERAEEDEDQGEAGE